MAYIDANIEKILKLPKTNKTLKTIVLTH